MLLVFLECTIKIITQTNRRMEGYFMKTITINTIKTEDFTRVNSDVYGNPRYVLHYLNIADNYLTACNIASTIGGKSSIIVSSVVV